MPGGAKSPCPRLTVATYYNPKVIVDCEKLPMALEFAGLCEYSRRIGGPPGDAWALPAKVAAGWSVGGGRGGQAMPCRGQARRGSDEKSAKTRASGACRVRRWSSAAGRAGMKGLAGRVSPSCLYAMRRTRRRAAEGRCHSLGRFRSASPAAPGHAPALSSMPRTKVGSILRGSTGK